MQTYSLTVDKFLDHTGKWTPDREVIWAEGGTVKARFGYGELRARANRLSSALAGLGVEQGDRVGTLAWNTRHHLELYYGIMGMGAVCHTLNPRLTTAQLAAIVREAGDVVLAVATDLLALALEIREQCPSLRHLIELDCVEGGATSPEALGYEALLSDQQDEAFAWGAFAEGTPAGLCYTSGTTGQPKGVLYTHRSNYLHTLFALQADAVGLTAADTLLMAVPMFHANGWGLPFAAPAAGASLVLPGRQLDGESLLRIMRDEDVTLAAGVQTVWLGLVDYLDEVGGSLPALERIIVGGSACPEALIDRLEARLGARVQTSWGMTELSPIGTMALAGAPAQGVGAGRPRLGVDLKLTDAEGNTLAEQCGVLGHLKVKGAAVIDRYFATDEDVLDAEGYFDTGDLATIDAEGNLTIQGRAKDLIKSGGEWINPAEIEAIVGTHPSVRHVAVIARPDPRWGERPVLVVERDPADPDANLLGLLRGQVADWWIPNEIVEVAAMPLAATGKIDKVRLRADLEAGNLVAQAA
ncbi:AMP-binding protein [Croceibacterium aestuarii]|uniref:AMP-binding protein n=1 Tax=Croceibacterium aestuarii TaxID=3064139 RepID=UPI00272ED06D|nr:AMP-binding protein [Croceibacterium sp. D39]